MQFSFILATLLASVVGVLAQFPNCAAECITHADLGTCGSNNACLCQSEAFVKSTEDCFKAKCQPDDEAAALKISALLCQQAGVTTTPGVAQPTNTTNTAAQTTTSPSQTTTGGPQSSSPSPNGALSNKVVLGGLVGAGAGLIALVL